MSDMDDNESAFDDEPNEFDENKKCAPRNARCGDKSEFRIKQESSTEAESIADDLIDHVTGLDNDNRDTGDVTCSEVSRDHLENDVETENVQEHSTVSVDEVDAKSHTLTNDAEGSGFGSKSETEDESEDMTERRKQAELDVPGSYDEEKWQNGNRFGDVKSFKLNNDDALIEESRVENEDFARDDISAVDSNRSRSKAGADDNSSHQSQTFVDDEVVHDGNKTSQKMSSPDETVHDAINSETDSQISNAHYGDVDITHTSATNDAIHCDVEDIYNKETPTQQPISNSFQRQQYDTIPEPEGNRQATSTSFTDHTVTSSYGSEDFETDVSRETAISKTEHFGDEIPQFDSVQENSQTSENYSEHDADDTASHDSSRVEDLRALTASSVSASSSMSTQDLLDNTANLTSTSLDLDTHNIRDDSELNATSSAYSKQSPTINEPMNNHLGTSSDTHVENDVSDVELSMNARWNMTDNEAESTDDVIPQSSTMFNYDQPNNRINVPETQITTKGDDEFMTNRHDDVEADDADADQSPGVVVYDVADTADEPSTDVIINTKTSLYNNESTSDISAVATALETTSHVKHWSAEEESVERHTHDVHQVDASTSDKTLDVAESDMTGDVIPKASRLSCHVESVADDTVVVCSDVPVKRDDTADVNALPADVTVMRNDFILPASLMSDYAPGVDDDVVCNDISRSRSSSSASGTDFKQHALTPEVMDETKLSILPALIDVGLDPEQLMVQNHVIENEQRATDVEADTALTDTSIVALTVAEVHSTPSQQQDEATPGGHDEKPGVLFQRGLVCTDVITALEILKTRYVLADVRLHKLIMTWSSWNISELVRGEHKSSSWLKNPDLRKELPVDERELEELLTAEISDDEASDDEMEEICEQIERRELEIAELLQRILEEEERQRQQAEEDAQLISHRVDGEQANSPEAFQDATKRFGSHILPRKPYEEGGHGSKDAELEGGMSATEVTGDISRRKRASVFRRTVRALRKRLSRTQRT